MKGHIMEANAKGYTMGSFKFYCPHCEQKIEADESMRGEIANCPCCNEEIVVDELSSWKEICKTCDGAGTIVPPKQEKRNRTVKNKITQTPKWQAGNVAKQKTCWRCDGLGRKYTNGGNGEVCHVCNGFGVIHESSDSLYKNTPRSSKSSSDFDSSIIKGGCGSTVLLILYIIGGLIASVCLMGTAHSGNEGILCILGYIVITLIFAGFAFLFLLETWSKKITVSLLCFFIVFLIFCGVKGKRLGTSDFESHKRTNTANSGIPTEEELMYPMDGKDPKNWRKHEEDLENRLPHLKNAPYACKRCGMKSDRPLDDPQGIWGRNGVCAYCINYLRSKR